MANISGQKEKINVLIATAGLHIGGSEMVIKSLLKTINPQMFNVTIACIRGLGFIGEELKSQGYNIILLSNTPDGSEVNYFSFLKLLKVIRQKNIDIVHTHTKDALADAAVCKIFRPSFRLIHTFHFGNYHNLKLKNMWIEQVFSRFANRLIAVGEIQKNQIKKVLNIKEKSISKVWNGISINKDKVDFSFNEQLGIGNKIIIGTICTLTEQKGLFDLLEVAKNLGEYKNQIRFVIVGDGPLRSKLEKIRKEYGLEETVIFAGWIKDAASKVLPKFDIFFQPSLWEAMSIVILEAMGAAKPIVATKVGENSKIIENKKNGLLTEPGDISGMVNALKMVIDNSELRKLLGKAAKAEVLNHFTVEKMTRNYEKIYIEEYNKKWFSKKKYKISFIF